jgi:F-type H+-transporting ATPase subunit gamma
MSKTKELKERFESIDETRGIIGAMRALAFMETKKLNRYLADQGRASDSIREAASDLLAFYPMLQLSSAWSSTLLVALGADRGFCGGFNDEIVEAVRGEIEASVLQPMTIVAVGDRLASKLLQISPAVHTIVGATFTEEVPSVIASVSRFVGSYIDSHQQDSINVKLLAHQHGSSIAVIEPLSELRAARPQHGSPPQLTMEPAKVFSLLLDQYFRFVLYHLFYSSLMAENSKRIMHLDTALRRLDEEHDRLKRMYYSARQEEITEEIEVLIMNAKGLRPTGKCDVK